MKDAKDIKNAPNWLKKAGQDTNIEANYHTHGKVKEVAKETTERGLMSYWQWNDRGSKQI